VLNQKSSRLKVHFCLQLPSSQRGSKIAFLEAANATPRPDNNQISYSVPVSPERPPHRRQSAESLQPPNPRRQSNDSIRSGGSTNSGRSSSAAERGEFLVQDSGVPIRPVKIQEDEVDIPAAGKSPNNPSSLSPSNLTPARTPISLKGASQFKQKRLHVLVAEDDPANCAILKKRLEIDGHEVTLTKDGSEAVETFAGSWRDCDIILMDLQVHI